MQHAHVKRKENHMNRYILEEFHNDPALRRRLFSNARRERNRSLRAGLKSLRGWLAAHLSPRQDLSRWLTRLG
jgi:hypothetical protein